MNGVEPERVIRKVPVLGTCLVAGGLACTAWRGAIGVYWFREWWRWRVADPSTAELYQINWGLEIIPTVFGLVIASIGIALLRRR